MDQRDQEQAVCDCGGAPDARALADEILRYLHSHHRACDTPEGIARWWIKRQRLEDTVERVQAALDLLVADNRVVAQGSGGGPSLYRLAPAADGSH